MSDGTANAIRQMTTYVTFSVCGMQCALSIDEVDEIKRSFQITRVHGAPPYINGVVNIRGQIVTVIDLGRRLGLENDDPSRQFTMVIISKHGEKIGLLVDTIEDTITINSEACSVPPPNIQTSMRMFIRSVCKTNTALIAVIDRDAVADRERNGTEEASGT